MQSQMVGGLVSLCDPGTDTQPGRIRNPENMITAKIGLRNAVTDGFDALLAQKDKHVKILVTPDESLL